MRALATALISVAMALGALGLAVAAPHSGGPDAPAAALAAASGAVQITNSREGEALFDAAAMRPGQGVHGSVRIGNTGDAAGSFSVRLTGVQDTPGPYGGLLSERVQLALVDMTDPQRSTTLYAGTAGDFGVVGLGTIEPGAQRDYRLAAALTSGAGDNYFQGSALSLGLEWRAISAGEAPGPTPTPAPPVTADPPQSPAVTLPPVPPGAGEVLGRTPPRRCVKRRSLTVRLKAPRGARVRSAKVKFKGKVKARAKGAKKRVRVKLRGLPAGRVKLVVKIRASNGRSYKTARRYSTCKPR